MSVAEAVGLEFSVKLGADELRLLDGRCGPGTQAEIELLKEADGIAGRHSGTGLAAAHFVARALREARASGRLSCMRVSMNRCPVTGRRAEYVKPRRATRDNPFKSPVAVPFPGWELKRSFLVVQGYPSLGICDAALVELRPVLAAELARVPAAVPETVTGHAPLWVREDVVACRSCGWRGRESLCSGRDPHWFGRRCPGCGVRTRNEDSRAYATGKDVDFAFEVIPASQAEAEKAAAAAAMDMDRPWLPVSGDVGLPCVPGH
jgi:hypothetical protein